MNANMDSGKVNAFVTAIDALTKQATTATDEECVAFQWLASKLQGQLESFMVKSEVVLN